MHVDRFPEMERKALDLAEGDTLLHTDLHPLNEVPDEFVVAVYGVWLHNARKGKPRALSRTLRGGGLGTE